MTTPEFSRDAALTALGQRHFDVLVVGGGVTGAGIALDAAARGLSTALVERDDLASGTSSKSSKLVHGGLRYLQQKEYRLVMENLAERQRLLRNAPHLVAPLAFLIPLFGRGGVVNRTVAKVYSGALWTYDLVGGLRIGHRHRRIGGDEVAELFPALRRDTLVAGFLYWDARADDARLTLTLARTAAAHGAVVANYAPVEAMLHEGPRVVGARLGPAPSPATGADPAGIEVKARVVVNATGVWADDLRRLESGVHPGEIRPAKGVHITLPADRLRTEVAAVLPVPGDRRSVFVIPWGERVYVGTTDTDYQGPLDDPQCTAEDVDYLLGAVNAFVGDKLSPADVVGSWAGLRPLIASARSERTADLSRRHAVTVSPEGVVTVTGGKLTTYRKMAQDTVDAAVGVLGAPRRMRRCPTRRLRLVGAGEASGRAAPARTAKAAEAVVDAATLEHLRGRYGSETEEVLALIAADPTLGAPLVPGLPYLRAEAVRAARTEMAVTLEDVLSRRTRALLLDRAATEEAAPAVAGLLAGELGWSDDEQRRQVDAFVASVARERQATAP